MKQDCQQRETMNAVNCSYNCAGGGGSPFESVSPQ
jgi:hypothetical protein